MGVAQPEDHPAAGRAPLDEGPRPDEGGRPDVPDPPGRGRGPPDRALQLALGRPRAPRRCDEKQREERPWKKAGGEARPARPVSQGVTPHREAPSEPSRVVIVMPPSMTSVWPVTQRASSLVR